MIFHLVSRSAWETGTGELVAAPGREGFVHCCDEQQIDDVRLRYFLAEDEVVALAVDPTRLASETRYERGSGGEGERFAHVYGGLRRDAVAWVCDC
ncbi:MAG: DUF952 domain-containing protein [Acidimicrobiales bacterium]